MPGIDEARADALRRLAAGAGEAERASSFEGAELAGIALPRSSLRDVDLSGADLSGADFSDAACGGTRLARARLEEAVFRRADLSGADLSDVRAGEADFSEALLEDARLDRAVLRFAKCDGAVLDGATLAEADLWGASLEGAAAERACLRGARLDEARAGGANFAGSDLTGAILRRADLSGASLRGAVLRDAVLDGASLRGADLSHAVLPFVVLTECDLRHVRLAGAWLERTRMHASQLGGAVGEEVAREYDAAYEAYTALELNFRSLGRADEESWAFRRRRRMGKHGHRVAALAALRAGALGTLWVRGGIYLIDLFIEWLSDYGESLTRVFRAFVTVLLGSAVLYWATASLVAREDIAGATQRGWVLRVLDYLLFSLDSMTTVGTGFVGLRPAGEFAVVLSSLETVLGVVLLGLFGFVLGARMRR